MNSFTVTIATTGRQFSCPDTDNVLVGMRYVGPDGIQVGCRGGGCGVCRVEVLEGTYLAKKMSKAHVTEEDLARNIVLSCRIVATSDLIIRPCPRVPLHQT
jgi:ferredoxin